MKADTVKIILASVGVALIIGTTSVAYALRTSSAASQQALRSARVAQRAAFDAHRGLCTLKQGYVKQYRDTIKALNAPPDSDLGRIVQQFGRKVFLNSAAGLKRRVKDLEDVKCS